MTRTVAGLLALLLLAGAGGCDSRSGTTGDAGGLRVTIHPTGFNPRTTDPLTANAQISQPTGGTPTFAFSWTRDGVDAMNNTKTVPSSATAKHQVWEVTVTATVDGASFGPVTAQVTIANTPPVINTLSAIQPPSRCSSATLSVNATTSDADGDPVTLSYLWTVTRPDSSVVTATTPTLDPSFTAVNDVVTVTLTPNDGEVDGASRSAPAPFPFPEYVIQDCLTAPSGGGSTSGAASASSALTATAGGVRLSGPAPVPRLERASDEPVASAAAPSAWVPAARPLDVGDHDVCSVDADGGLACSGDDASALGDPPAGRHLAVAVAADYACAIRADDLSLRCWGAPPEESGLLDAPDGAFVRLALGSAAACGVRVGGALACWGADATSAAPDGAFVDVDVSGATACAIDADAGVVCWGE